MPQAGRACSECGTPFSGGSVQRKTCGEACRKRRQRRIARVNREVAEFQEQNNAASSEIAQIVRNQGQDVISRVLKEELAPIVREAMTEDVLRSINELVGLTPRAVAAIQEDLESADSVIRQRAYTLLIKYTVGHPALIKPETVEPHAQMVVNFTLPRPDDPEVTDLLGEDSDELRLCDMCETEKPASEFVAGSARCATCFAEWKATVIEQFS